MDTKKGDVLLHEKEGEREAGFEEAGGRHRERHRDRSSRSWSLSLLSLKTRLCGFGLETRNNRSREEIRSPTHNRRGSVHHVTFMYPLLLLPHLFLCLLLSPRSSSSPGLSLTITGSHHTLFPPLHPPWRL